MFFFSLRLRTQYTFVCYMLCEHVDNFWLVSLIIFSSGFGVRCCCRRCVDKKCARFFFGGSRPTCGISLGTKFRGKFRCYKNCVKVDALYPFATDRNKRVHACATSPYTHKHWDFYVVHCVSVAYIFYFRLFQICLSLLRRSLLITFLRIYVLRLSASICLSIRTNKCYDTICAYG